ncbi:hypothetical protein INR49_004623 [Caranx melampygus]|nr:hypothetical protein INR49_004623 [Caranx melampygus]
MLVHSLLLLIALSCSCTEGDCHDNPPADMMIGAAQSPAQTNDEPTDVSHDPKLLELVQDPHSDGLKKVLDLLTELVLTQKDIAKHQAQVVQQLGVLETLGSQQIQDLQNMARHQSLLVENHQALLLQTSRIATYLQDIIKKPAAATQ